MTAEFEPTIIGFLCNWCSYAGADMTGTSRLSYPPSIRIIRVPCSGRIEPLYVLKAFLEGADGVLVAGCHPGDCHYGDGNYYARRRYALMRSLLSFVGIEPERLQIDWVSAAEGNRFAQVVTKLSEQVKQLGPWTGLRCAAPEMLPVSIVLGSRIGNRKDPGRQEIRAESSPAAPGGSE